MILRLFTAVFLLTIHSSSYARLNETEAQLLERYGNPIMRSGEMAIEQGKILKLGDRLHFKVDDWNLVTVMIAGRCEAIIYSKKGEWTEEQFSHVLNANNLGSQWKEQRTPAPKMLREWKRTDGAVAKWQLTQAMTLTSPAYDRAREALKKRGKEDASKLPKL